MTVALNHHSVLATVAGKVSFMVEMKYDEKNGDFKLPKNIRQVGQSEGDTRIYVEDYVITFLNERAKEAPTEEKLAILLGDTVAKESQTYIFIHGAVAVEHINIQEDHIGFTSGIWTGIYEDIEKYFDKAKVAGWFLTRPGKSLKVTEQMLKVHTDNFPGDGKVLMLLDPVDCDEQFYIYKHGILELMKGYYIYYERNESMQNYMIDYRKKNEKPDLMDQVIEEMLEDNPQSEKSPQVDDVKTQEERTKKINKMTRYAAVFAFLVMAVSAAAIMKRYEDRQTGQSMSSGTSAETGVLNTENESYVSVWTTSEEQINSNDDTLSQKSDISTAGSDDNSSPNTGDTSGQPAGEDTTIVDNQNNSNEQNTNNTDLSNSDASNSNGQDLAQQQEAKDIVKTALRGMKYTVKEGDTLAQISEHYYASIAYVDAICILNDIDNADKIYPGMEIELP